MKRLFYCLPGGNYSQYRAMRLGLQACVDQYHDWYIEQSYNYKFSDSSTSKNLYHEKVIQQQFHACVGYAHYPVDIRTYHHLKTPVILVLPDRLDPNLISLHEDLDHTVHLTIEHLLKANYQSLAMIDQAHTESPRRINFSKQLKEQWCAKGRKFKWIKMRPFEAQLKEWLSAQKQKCAYLSFTRNRIEFAHQCARRLNMQVPDDLGLVCLTTIDKNDLTFPTVTSFSIDGYAIGYQAAKMAIEWADTGIRPKQPEGLKSHELVVRKSTHTAPVTDLDIRHVLHYIDEHYQEDIQVEDMLNQLSISRRTLERKMMDITGHSPKELLMRKRLEALKEMLTSTKLSMSVVAAHAGFNDPRYMSRLFKQHFQITPREYRKQHSR